MVQQDPTGPDEFRAFYFSAPREEVVNGLRFH
jgi:hypothetical protein